VTTHSETPGVGSKTKTDPDFGRDDLSQGCDQDV